MALFKPKGNIQLGAEQADSNQGQRPTLFSRSSSKWSIPCCSSLSLGRGGAIQLPDDSDLEDEEYNEPDFTHSQNIVGRLPVEPTAFLQNQTDNTHILSRNPFARAPNDDFSEQNKQNDTTIKCSEENQDDTTVERFEAEATGDEELSNVTRSSFTRYENEPDWTESYKDDDEDSIKEGLKVQQVDDNFQEVLNDDQSVDTPNDQEEQVDKSCVEEKVPQIEEEVLHLLPLPQLSKEIPPTLIHKKPSFEKSMYGDKPLTSLSQTDSQSNRFSRFSMTEEEYLVLKKKEEEERRQSFTVTALENQTPPSNVSQLEVVSQDPLSLPAVPIEATKDNQKQSREVPKRRASIVSAAAHSLLGDKLDDFTEKLAFIKKNIIMNADSDEEDEEEADNTESILKKIEESKLTKANSGTEQRPQTLHRRASSLMDVAPTIARFMNHISGTNTDENSNSAATQLSSSQSSASSFSPSSLFSALAGPMPEPSPSTVKERKTIQEVEEEDDEELFDFTKVIEIGKNMKTFSEGVVGNSIRMLNDVATRVKTELQQQEEEQVKQERELSTSLNASTSTTSTVHNEDEWMHNYL